MMRKKRRYLSFTIAIYIIFLIVFLLFSFLRSKYESYLLRLACISFRLPDIITQKMGCFQSSESIDFDTIQPAVLRSRGGLSTYSGSTERGRCQVC